MKVRIIKDEHGYALEKWVSSTNSDASYQHGCWNYISGSLCFTKWGALFRLWRLQRIKPKPPFVVIKEIEINDR